MVSRVRVVRDEGLGVCAQVLMLTNFKDFPSTALTVEFWMWSVDTCRDGVPISYATDSYEKGDNTFLIFNYRNW